MQTLPFKPPLWLANPHIQTILPKFVAPEAPPYRRVLVKDSLNESDVAFDFYDADEHKSDDALFTKPLVVLFHGMEGSSTSHYAKALAHHIHHNDWHFVVAHFRSCGGVPACGTTFYDAGDTDEVEHVMRYLKQRYQTIYAIGTSLGGSVLSKYLGERGSDALCQAAVVVSAPLDLASSSVAMERLAGRKIYTPYLLNPIINKALESQLSSDEVKAIRASRSISEFDDVFTAPRRGYRSKNDYYRQASALPLLVDVAVPSLIISAKDDPFLGILPKPGDVSADVMLSEPDHGGHIGFISWQERKFDVSWLSKCVVAFFSEHR